MSFILSPVVFAMLAVLLALVLVVLLYARNYVKVPPNQVAVFTGRGKQKIVRGGARFKMPIVERVDFMSLEPFDVQIAVENVYSMDGVPISVTGVGLVRFGSTDDMVATAVERFLNTDPHRLNKTVTDILAGNMRSIVSQMTVEDLSNKRDDLTRRVREVAADAYQPIGMELDVLTIQSISDNNGYLDALGQKRIAEVKRDAEIGQAEARRDAMISSAEADRLGKTAQAEAATQIAQAERERDIELAKISALVERERATAAQSGPLAEAEARRAVVIAETDVERQREQAQIAVQEQRALREEQAQRADTIVPAEARRQAAILEAEGQRDAAIAGAEAEARSRTLAGEADANARKVLAEARQIEMEAEAAGEEAGLKAQAEGQRELAAALNAFTEQATRLQLLPQIIAAMPGMATAIAAQIGQIDKMVVVDGGGNGEGGDMMSRLTSSVPAGIAAVIETIRATTRMDVRELAGNGDTTAPPLVEAPEKAVPLASSDSDAD